MENSIIKELYSELQNASIVGKELIIKEILSYIIPVENKIDFERIVIRDTLNRFEFVIFSKGNKNCPFSFFIEDDYILNIQIGQGAEYLYNYNIQTWNDIGKLRATLNDFFTNEITEEVIICRGKPIKYKYTIPYKSNGVDYEYKLYYIIGSCWFFEKKHYNEIVYQKWQ